MNKTEKDYITLQQFLKLNDIIDTGGYAKIFLAENTVYINGEQETRRGRKLYRGDVIQIDERKFVIMQ